MQSYLTYVPEKSIPKLQSWIDELGVFIKLTKPRRTKLGDFKTHKGNLVISINNDLNPYSFLITLTHELAHAFIYKNYKNTINPHGKEWQLMFKSMLFNFLTPDYFPKDILEVLSLHIRNPKASTLSDIRLSSVLRTYNIDKTTTISDINEGEQFNLSDGRLFVKGSKLRKRYRCIEKNTNKVYLFHPLADVSKV